MKLIIVHGDHVTKSYDRLTKFVSVARNRGWAVTRIADKAKSLAEALVAQDLFTSEKLVVVEGINLIGKKDLEYLHKKHKALAGNLILYNNAPLAKTAINKFPKPDKVEEYKLPKKLWTFLDSLFPGNSKNSLFLFTEVVETEPPEFVFALIARLMRDLYWAKVDAKSMNLPSWRLGKLRSQASKFTDGQIENLISELAEIDIKVKTSKAELSPALEFLIASQLE